LKKLVASRVSERIVDVFEAVQIQKEHGDLFAVTRRQGDRLTNAVVQEHSIRQSGQKVVLG
jgi:alkyl hydroperoxide reductase subunit AhpC